jgi:hypothetical protein
MGPVGLNFPSGKAAGGICYEDSFYFEAWGLIPVACDHGLGIKYGALK